MRRCNNCGGTAFKCIKCNRILTNRPLPDLPAPSDPPLSVPKPQTVADFRAAKERGAKSAVKSALQEALDTVKGMDSEEASKILQAAVAACIKEL